ncbi:hypothetical protein QC764_0027590 [Podospora pseudoanserina]|uniref:Uncharacterized protein n=1 Tax=Podospora pseudoanserina TaxID=2609844 RepID=A0ABR0IS68_9PEZI|nr:hypothetical protein QC764_0027590 [Podospora pseudoanserina]
MPRDLRHCLTSAEPLLTTSEDFVGRPCAAIEPSDQREIGKEDLGDGNGCKILQRNHLFPGKYTNHDPPNDRLCYGVRIGAAELCQNPGNTVTNQGIPVIDMAKISVPQDRVSIA